MKKQKDAPIDGLMIYDKKHTDSLLVDPLFLRAKQGDRQAAFDLIQKLWTFDKTRQALAITQRRPTVFISVPGTSRRNQIPPVFAEFLADVTEQSFLIGDEYVASLHATMMKSVKNSNRLMRPRMYEPYEKRFFDQLRAVVGNGQKQVILVEDVVTTGSSVNSFRRFLEKNGIPVAGIFGVKGDYDIVPSTSEIQKLQKIATRAGISVDMEKLGQELSKSEVISLTYQFLAEKYKAVPARVQRLMRHQLRCLYEIKVNQNLNASVKLDRICSMMQRLEEKNAKTILGKNDNILRLLEEKRAIRSG
mgnify:CR=1 FL=1